MHRHPIAASMLFALGLTAPAACAAPAPARTPTAVAPAERAAVQGVVTALDTAARMLVVSDPSGEKTTFYWDDATHFAGELQSGSNVRVEAVRREGRNIATTIHVEPTKSY